MTVQERFLAYARTIFAESGNGGHNATFKVALAARHGFLLTVEEAFPPMMEWNRTNTGGEPWSEEAILHKLNSADGAASHHQPGYLLEKGESHHRTGQSSRPRSKPKQKWPEIDKSKVVKLIKDHPVPVEDLNALSSIPTARSYDCINLEAYLDLLFCQGSNSDPFITIGWNAYQANTRLRSEWTGGLKIPPQFIVPNCPEAREGTTQAGEKSARAKSNYQHRRFIIVECDYDHGKHPEIFEAIEKAEMTVQSLCSTVLIHLAKLAPLVMAVNSGGRSIHGWFPASVPRKLQYTFFREACTLGADPAMAQPHQWTRFPGGRRGEEGPIQTVEYFNLDPNLLKF